jgi:putative flippase GtrA
MSIKNNNDMENGRIKTNGLKSVATIKYIFWGVATTIVSILTYFSLLFTYKSVSNLEVVYTLINGIFTTISSIVGIVFAFYTNRRFVFESGAATKKEKALEFISFSGSRLATLILDLVFVIIGSIYFPGHEILIKTVSQIVIIILNYILTKLVFSINY